MGAIGKIITVLLLLVSGGLLAQNVLLPVKQDGKWGYIDTMGVMVIPPAYEYAGMFDGNAFAKVQLNGRPYAITRTGSLVDIKIPLAKQEALKNFVFFMDSFILHKDPLSEKWGMYNLDFNPILAPEYDSIYATGTYYQWWQWRIAGAQVAVIKNGLTGIADAQGRIIIEPKFTAVFHNWNGHYQVHSNDSTGLYNLQGQQVLPVIFNTINTYHYNSKYILALANTGGWGMYDTLGQQVLPHGYTGIRYVNETYAVAHKGDSSWLLSTITGKMIPVNGFIGLGNTTGSGILVKAKTGNGIINTDGEIILPPIYRFVFNSDGYWLVNAENLWGLYNGDGDTIFAPQFTFIDEMQDNVALIRQDSLWGMVNIHGEVIIPPRYEEIDLYNNTAKARAGKTIDMYELTGEGRLEEVVNYNNVLTIRVNTRSNDMLRRARNTRQAITAANNSRRIDSLWFTTARGWYRDTVSLKWGFKDANSNVVIAPMFDKINTSDTSTYAIVEIEQNPPLRVNLLGVNVQFSSLKGLVNQYTGQVVAKPLYFYIDETILTHGQNYALALYRDGTFNIITHKGRLLKNTGIRFADKPCTGITRVYLGNTGHSRKCQTGEDNCVELRKYIRQLGGVIEKDQLSNETYYIDFVKGNWDYINSLGYPQKLNLKQAGNFSSHRAIVQTQSGYYGLLSDKFIYVITPKYNHISYLPNSNRQQLLVTINKYLEGYVSSAGEMVTGVVFTRTNNFSEGRAWVQEDYADGKSHDAKYTLIDTNGLQVGNIAFEKVHDFKNGYAAVCHFGRWGFVDINGDTAVHPQYRKTGDYSEGLAWVNHNGRIGYIDETGEMVIKPQFKDATGFSSGLAAVKIEGKWGYIDTRGKMVIKAVYSLAKPFSAGGYAMALKGNRWGVLNTDGKWVLSPKYRKIQPLQNEVFLVTNGKKTALFNAPRGQLKKLGRYNAVVIDNARFIGLTRRGQTAFASINSETPASNTISNFRNAGSSLVVSGRNKEVGALNMQGDTIIPFENLKIEQVGDGFVKVLKRGKGYTLYDSLGNTVGCCYNNIGTFKDGLAPAAGKNGKWGLINHTGLWVSEPKYTRIHTGANGYTRVGLDAVSMVSDLNGSFITNGSFESLQYVAEANLYRIEQRNRLGYFSPRGRWVWQLAK